MGITTALQLADYDHKTLRRLFNINVERTARELTGEGVSPWMTAPSRRR